MVTTRHSWGQREQSQDTFLGHTRCCRRQIEVDHGPCPVTGAFATRTYLPTFPHITFNLNTSPYSL